MNSMFRLGYLLDETIVFRSPRDKVLKLIRMTNPNLFVQTIVNGFYNASFSLHDLRKLFSNIQHYLICLMPLHTVKIQRDV